MLKQAPQQCAAQEIKQCPCADVQVIKLISSGFVPVLIIFFIVL